MTSVSAIGQLFDSSQRGNTMNGRRAVRSRMICHDALPFPTIIDALSSIAGTTPPRKISPTSSRLARCGLGRSRGATPPRYTIRRHVLAAAARTNACAEARSVAA